MSSRIAIALAALAVVACITAAPLAARAELPPLAGSVYGGGVEVSSRGALSVGAGWPSTYVRYDFHTSGRFGIGLRGDFNYGMPVWGFSTGLGVGFGVPMRINVLERGDWNLAIRLNAAFFAGFSEHFHDWPGDDDAAVFGPNLGVGLIASVSPERFISIHFGMNFDIFIMIVSPENWDRNYVDVYIPINPFVGIELEVAESVALFANLSFGPAVRRHHRCRHWDGRDEECDDWHTDTDIGFNGQFYFGAIFFFG